MVTAGFESAIGHQAAAQFLSLLLKVDVPVQRVSIAMEPGDQAIVLRLLRRLPEGAVLDQQAMQQVPFELGLLKRVS